jgi:hypothetical protein
LTVAGERSSGLIDVHATEEPAFDDPDEPRVEPFEPTERVIDF